MGPSRWSRGIASDSEHETTICGLVRRLDGKATDSLTSVREFNETLKHATNE
jgi:hypothetical protein